MLEFTDLFMYSFLVAKIPVKKDAGLTKPVKDRIPYVCIR